MTKDTSGGHDEAFMQRRKVAMERINQIDAQDLSDNPHRDEFFNDVYCDAGDDVAMIPWADMAAKSELIEWLANSRTNRGYAIDIGCGLGDNAEALAEAGYDVTAFDFSPRAIDWAKKRFPDSGVSYREADLFELPSEWQGGFDLVNECYTLQSLPPETLADTIPAIAELVAPGGTLLVYSRTRHDGAPADGPPWPLEQTSIMAFSGMGFELVSQKQFELTRHERIVPHSFQEWRKGSLNA